jgi:hypothetical protein
LVGLVIAPILGDGHDKTNLASPEKTTAVEELPHIEGGSEVMQMRLKNVKVNISGAAFEGIAMADLSVRAEGEIFNATIEVSSEDAAFSGTFTSMDGMFDGMMFHASGLFATGEGSEFHADADFFRNEEGDIQDFHMGIH